MKRRISPLFFGLVMAMTAAVGACSSDDPNTNDTTTTENVVAGAPLTITDPTLVDEADATVVVGTLRNVTDRTIEITSASSSAGEIEFRSADGSLLAALTIDPDSEFVLAPDGVHLELLDATTDDTVDVVLGLDIQDDFDFTAQRSAG